MRSFSQRRSKLQEKRAALEMGGRVQKGSGSSEFAKGDFRTIGKIRGECKLTKKDKYRLKLDELLKIKKEAVMGGAEDWVMQVSFLGAGGQTTKFAVIDCAMFIEMANFAKKRFLLNEHYQVGKSYEFEKIWLRHAEKDPRVINVIFDTGNNQYSIVPWESYLDIRRQYMEREQDDT